MYLGARRLIALTVGLSFLAPLHTCLALPASSVSPVVRDPESLSVIAPPSSDWETDNDTLGPDSLYEHSANQGLRNKRDQQHDFLAESGGGEERSWLIRRQFDHVRVGTLDRTDESESDRLGQGNYGQVWPGEWKPVDACEPIPVAIKISAGKSGYYSARNISGLESPNIVKVYQSAWSQDGKSIVAYERLGKSAAKAEREGTLQLKPFEEATMLGALAGVEQNKINMDIHVENVLFGHGQWKIIDWDLLIIGPPEAKHEGFKGAFDFMAPEMMALVLKKTKEPWKAGPAQVWSIAINFLNLRNPEYSGKITREMKSFLREFEKKALKGQWSLGDKDNRWYWVALQVAHLQDKASPSQILKILPSKYRDGGKRDKAWGKWFSRTLSKSSILKKRYTLQQAWKAYRDLKLE